MILTSDEKEETLRKAFMMLNSLLSDKSFFGRGASVGPQVIMTDNCTELRQVLRETWNESVLLLCVFHILQQIWRRLYDKSHSIYG